MFTIEPLRTSKKVSYRALYQVVPSLSPPQLDSLSASFVLCTTQVVAF